MDGFFYLLTALKYKTPGRLPGDFIYLTYT